MDRAGSLRSDVAGYSVRPGKLAEETLDAVLALLDGWIDFGVGAFKIGICNNARTAMAGPDDVDHVDVVRVDDAIQVHINEVQTGRRSPVAEQARLDVIHRQRPLKQRIIFQ